MKKLTHLERISKFKSMLKLSNSGCMEWTGAKRGLYGVFRFNDKYPYAHRVAWEIENGPIPEGLQVCHKCDNPPCCNPLHLFLGTAQENTTDKMVKGRGEYLIGERNTKAKLSNEDVSHIKNILIPSGIPIREIAVKFNVGKTAIEKIKNQTNWSHIK